MISLNADINRCKIMVIEKYQKWSEHEYSTTSRIIALFILGLLFVIAIPFLLVVASSFLDQWMRLPIFFFGLVNMIISLVLIIIGILFALWSIQVQFVLGRGTPAPMMPTQKLVVQKPYTYCRNPMSLGTTVLYFGIAIWIGSISAAGLALLFAVLLMVYNKLIEEKELEKRFGNEYKEYMRITPFMIPRFEKKN